MDWLLRRRKTKVAETDRLIPNDAGASSLLYPYFYLLPLISYHIAPFLNDLLIGHTWAGITQGAAGIDPVGVPVPFVL